MNQQAFKRICHILEAHGVEYKILRHAACRTSIESAEARAQAGFPNTIGAKALVTKMTFTDKRSEFNVLILPGISRLNVRALKEQIPGLQKLRFATPDELFDLCEVSPGAMPPFGTDVFSKLNRLFVDLKISDIETIGFNVADLERSIVMRGSDYIRVANPDAVLAFTD